MSGAALLSHSYPDGVVRARLRKNAAPQPFLSPPSSCGGVSLLRSHPDSAHVWVAHRSGKIEVVGLAFHPKELSLSQTDEKVRILFLKRTILVVRNTMSNYCILGISARPL